MPRMVMPASIAPSPLTTALFTPREVAPEPRLSAVEEEKIKEQMENIKQIRAVMQTLSMVLGPKALLLIAMLGALGLTIPALVASDWQHLLAAVSFDVLVFWPTVYLYLKG